MGVMRRLALNFAVFAALGAIVSVMVAWSCAIWAPIVSVGALSAEESHSLFDELGLSGEESQREHSTFVRARGRYERLVDRDLYLDVGDYRSFHGGDAARMVEAGWPFRCVKGYKVDRPAISIPQAITRLMENGGTYDSLPYDRNSVGLLELPNTVRDSTSPAGFSCASRNLMGPVVMVEPALPWIPMWTGLTLDAAIYGLILRLLCLVPSAIKRTLRRRRGACVKCGYDRRATANSLCPECGSY